MASVTPFGQERRKSGRRGSTTSDGYGDSEESNHRLPQKDWNRSYFTRASRASELHNLLSCHHRPDGEGIDMPVVTFLRQRAENVLWEDQVPAFNTRWTAQFCLKSNDVATFQTLCVLTWRLLQSSSEAEMDDRLKPKSNGVLGHPFLSPASRDEERRNIKTKLFLMGQRSSSFRSPPTKSSRGNCKLFKPRVRHGKILDLGNYIQKERESAGPPTARMP